MSKFQYDKVDITTLVKSGPATNPVSPRYTKLPGDTGSKVADLYLITTIGYKDSVLGEPNLAYYYMPYTVVLDTVGTSNYTCPINFKNFNAIIIGGGGGGGGSAGVLGDTGYIMGLTAYGGGGGSGGAGGTYVLNTRPRVPDNRVFTYTVGGGGGGGNGFYMGRKKDDYRDANGGGIGTASVLLTYTGAAGNGGAGGTEGFGTGPRNKGADGGQGNGGSGSVSTYNGSNGVGGSKDNEVAGGLINSYDNKVPTEYGYGGKGAEGVYGPTGDNNTNETGADGNNGGAGGSGYIAIYLFRDP